MADGMNPLTVVSWFLEWRKVRTACPSLVCKGGARAGRYMVALSQRTAALELLWSNTWGYADKVRKTYRISLFVREKENEEFIFFFEEFIFTVHSSDHAHL